MDVDLTEGWTLHDDGQDVVISGPGGLEIVLAGFDPTRLEHEEGLGPEAIGSLRQLSWSYPLTTVGVTGEVVWLQVITTWDSAVADAPRQHRLHIETPVMWQLPTTVGERLHGWLVRQEEPRPGA